jgi:hypothetical protein
MAKTTEAKAVTEKGKKGVGWRHCESCDYSTKGPRSTKCGKCGVDFPPPKAKAGKKTAKRKGKRAPSPNSDTLSAAIGLVKSAGGFDRAKAILAELEQVKGL